MTCLSPDASSNWRKMILPARYHSRLISVLAGASAKSRNKPTFFVSAGKLTCYTSRIVLCINPRTQHRPLDDAVRSQRHCGLLAAVIRGDGWRLRRTRIAARLAAVAATTLA